MVSNPYIEVNPLFTVDRWQNHTKMAHTLVLIPRINPNKDTPYTEKMRNTQFSGEKPRGSRSRYNFPIEGNHVFVPVSKIAHCIKP